MRSQIEPAFALLHKNCEIRGFPTSFFRVCSTCSSSSRLFDSHTLSSFLPPVFTAKFYLSHSFPLFIFLSVARPLVLFSLFPNRFAIVFHVYTSPSLQTFHSIFDPSTGRALSHGSIFFFPFMDTRWVGSEKIQSKTGRSWTRETERKRYLRPTNKFIPSRERCDIGMHLYRRLGKMRCQIDTAREKLPMDVSFKDPLSVRVSSTAGSLSVSSSSTVPR